MTALNDRFWAKVLFKEFIKHYRKMTDEQIIADIHQSMDDLEDLVDTSASFGSKMVRWSMDRVDQYPQASENGKKGGRPRKNQESTADGDIREDSQDRKSGTSANLYGDAPHREAGDESANVSNNMRRVPQNEAPAHGFSGGRCRRTKPQRTDSAVGVPRRVLCPAPRRRLRNPGTFTTKKPHRQAQTALDKPRLGKAGGRGETP